VRIPLDRGTRHRIATIAGIKALIYIVTIYVTFYLAWTPIDSEWIWGVQGRYFVVILPLIGLGAAALVNRGQSETARALIATCGAVLSGGATVEAIIRATW
jgi:uncharacterized membrane protein